VYFNSTYTLFYPVILMHLIPKPFMLQNYMLTKISFTVIQDTEDGCIIYHFSYILIFYIVITKIKKIICAMKRNI